MPILTTLGRDRRGGTGILIAAAMPMLLGATALAVDLGSVQLESRKLQGIADAAALNAAGDPTRADALAHAEVARAGWDRKIAVTATAGAYSPAADIAPEKRFAADAATADAVRVRLSSRAPTFFAHAFGTASVPITRHATAARAKLASFSIGTRLLQLKGGLLNAYLSKLTGSQVSLSVADYNALADADVDLLTYLGALGTSADLRAASFDRVLDADVSGAQAVGAIVDALPAGRAKQAVARLASAVATGDLKVGDLIELGPLGTQDGGGEGVVKVGALPLATALLQLASHDRQVKLDLGAGLPGITRADVTLAIGERPAGSPWIAVTDNGQPVIRTAQARVYAETRLGNVGLPGLGRLVSLDLPIFVELASGEARLNDIACGQAGRSVTLDARPGLGTAAIADIDRSELPDFSHEISLRRARLLHLLLVDIEARSVVDLGNAEPWQQVRFSGDDIDTGRVRTVSSGHVVGGLTSSLASNLDLDVRAAGLLRLPAGPIVHTLAGRLDLLAPLLDQVLDLLTGAVGVHFGQADLRVTGMRCGRPVLVE